MIYEENRPKNWEKIREWINSLDKDKFIDFIKEDVNWTCDDLQEKLGIKIECGKCRFYDDAGCYRNLMNADYESEGERYEYDG